MPELPEVETVKRGLEQVMAGRTIAKVTQNRPDLRFPFPDGFRRRLAGKKILGLNRRAKYVLVGLEGDLTLLMHLGMSGRFEIIGRDRSSSPGKFHHPAGSGQSAGKAVQSHVHVIFHLTGGTDIQYADPRRFGYMDLIEAQDLETHARLADLGPEPLGNHMNGRLLTDIFKGKQRSLKAVLLDQKLIAGIGNIYACEALHRARLSPTRRAASLSTGRKKGLERVDTLAGAIRDVLSEAIAAGGSSLRDYVQTDGALGYFQHAFRVYDREGQPCARDKCGGTVKRIVQNNRSTFFCSSCQK